MNLLDLPKFLDLPDRTVKPRTTGLTMVIDGGMPTGAFEDALAAVVGHVDLVKLGWGTAMVTPDLDIKLSLLRNLGLEYYLGGTLFEKFVAQDRFDLFVDLCHDLQAETVEISNGTIAISNTAKAAYIRKCAGHFRVISEVGYKDPERSLHLSPSQWVDCIGEDFEAGASLVTTEARESGRSGICRADGELRFGLIEDIIRSGLDVRRLLFEAPTKDLQAWFVTRVGPNANLGNIAPTDVINLETLRLGLRSDTLMHFESLRAGDDDHA